MELYLATAPHLIVAVIYAGCHTFWKPSDQLVALLNPGDHVKLIFELTAPGDGEPSGERMWVLITERNQNDFVGRLDNEPRYIRDLPLGSMISFTAAHIIDSSVKDPIPDPTLKWQSRCFASNRILKDSAKIGFFYREEADEPRDSGWRFLCGDETGEYMDDTRNAQYVSLGAVLHCDDRIVDLLDQPAPIAYEWDDRTQQFKAAPKKQTP